MKYEYDKSILITGVAGFIGSYVAKNLLSKGCDVVGIDNLNDYYSVNLKQDRLKMIEDKKNENYGNFAFYKTSLEDEKALNKLFEKYNPKIIINLAAQAGVRYSLINPSAYIQSNIVGFGNLLESCRNFEIDHLIFASSSSVYGGNASLPFKEDQGVDHPVSLYAATKKSNELMAHSYSHLYGIPCTGLRFFTVYGPWGRPDMAPMIFAKSIMENKPIKVFNKGDMSRDFTFIEDIALAVTMCIEKIPTIDSSFSKTHPSPACSFAPYKIFNIGNSNSVSLLKFIELLEKYLGKKAIKDFQPLQPGDLIATYASIEKISSWINFIPQTDIEAGVEKFIKWFKDYYK